MLIPSGQSCILKHVLDPCIFASTVQGMAATAQQTIASIIAHTSSHDLEHTRYTARSEMRFKSQTHILVHGVAPREKLRQALHKMAVQLWIHAGGRVAVVIDEGHFQWGPLLYVYGGFYWGGPYGSRCCDGPLACIAATSDQQITRENVSKVVLCKR